MASAAAIQTPLKVLYILHPDVELLDFAGPLEILSHACFPAPFSPSDAAAATAAAAAEPVKVFQSTIAATAEYTTTSQKCAIRRDVAMAEAYAHLSDYDVLVIPGGGSSGVLEGELEPLGVIRAFAELPRRGDGRVRTLLSVCTGSLFVGRAGVLEGLVATTHPGYYGRLREICGGGTEVREERFVVNRVDERRGLRVVSSGGVSCGMDAALWLIGHVAGAQAVEDVAGIVQYARREGVVI